MRSRDTHCEREIRWWRMESPTRREDRITSERRTELYQGGRAKWVKGYLCRLAAKMNDSRLRAIMDLDHTRRINESELCFRSIEGRGGPLAATSPKGTNSQIAIPEREITGSCPESVNGDLTTHLRIASRNRLVGRHERCSVDVELEECFWTSKEVLCLR